MALDPLTAIAGAESSYGTNLFNPTSSATGIFQDLGSTWQSTLTAIGGNPSQYPTAASAPASVQFAVNSYLYNTQGFAPWTVGDPTLAAQIQAAAEPRLLQHRDLIEQSERLCHARSARRFSRLFRR